jgi:hypothetical protein
MYRFRIMTNDPAVLEADIGRFNNEHGTDLKVSRIVQDVVIFVEIQTSVSDEKLFDFGMQYGFANMRKGIEGCI